MHKGPAMGCALRWHSCGAMHAALCRGPTELHLRLQVHPSMEAEAPLPAAAIGNLKTRRQLLAKVCIQPHSVVSAYPFLSGLQHCCHPQSCS